jgi:methylase of polypeptide subunit release factors
MTIGFDPAAAAGFLKEAASLIGKGSESPLRHMLSAHLPKMFPGTSPPWWVKWHARGSETLIHSVQDGIAKRGFIDTLVGSTAIEYEKDLTQQKLAKHGEDQVREYCAGLLNRGVPSGNVIGVLSDTVRWHAYKIRDVLPKTSGQSLYGQDHVVLEEVESIDLSAAGGLEAEKLYHFLTRYLGRLGARVLDAGTLASDLGFESDFCVRHLEGIRDIVNQAFKDKPQYAKLIEKIWTDFVAYLGDSGSGGVFDRDTYVGELYVLTLAKLLCANVLAGKSLNSDDDELKDILDGSYFQTRGFSNLVEYDYFGWLNQGDYVLALLPVARDIQADLAAYDFHSSPAEDVFGALMAQLARRSQRLLLGQEWTPAWLAREIVKNVMKRLPQNDDPHLIDMCCGSGSFIVEAVKQTRERLDAAGVVPNAESVARLSQAITGFDIDPMAVMLAKVSWILAARDWLLQAGAFDVTIPVYHADSLFASTPVTKTIDPDGAERHALDLDGHSVSLPGFLISPAFGQLFDALVSTCYGVAMAAAKITPATSLAGAVANNLDECCAKTGTTLSADERSNAAAFVLELLDTLEALQRSGRNGIWAFILGNSYRPGLVSGMFNGLVSNPPWLAMSKVANNPYKGSLVAMAESHGIKPSGASHLHAEMATIFLLHAIARYLNKNAAVGCILPESVTTAHHHNPFRQADYLEADKRVAFTPDEVWRVEAGTFKNEAIVLFGQKVPAKKSPSALNGKLVSPSGLSSLPFYVIHQGKRTAWSNQPAASSASGFFSPAPFRQGADVFPRTAVFHDIAAASGRYNLKPIKRPGSALAYLVDNAKKFKTFGITANGVSKKYIFDVLLSNHLTPFRLESPAKGLLPLERNASGWRAATPVEISTTGLATSRAFNKFFTVAAKDSNDFFERTNTPRRKLEDQRFPAKGWLVVMGAGGKLVCAAYENLANLPQQKLIIDQTLYWVVVGSKDEALYLTGALNSEAVNLVIEQFQPSGQFGERHVHTLPFGVTPKFDRHDPAHMDVVGNTLKLIDQWDSDMLAHPAQFAPLLDLNQSLARRRTNLRKRLKTLPAYAAYDAACRNLYAV